MRKEIVSKSPDEVISLSDFKTHSKIDGIEYDAEIELYLNTVIELFNSTTGCYIGRHNINIIYKFEEVIKRSNEWWDGTREGAISSYIDNKCKFKIPVHPIINIVSVTAKDENNNDTVIADTNYFKLTQGKYPELKLKDTYSLPSMLHPYDALTINVDVGYEESNLPDDVKTAVLQFALFLFENRGDHQVMSNAKSLMGIPDFVALTFNKYKRKVI